MSLCLEEISLCCFSGVELRTTILPQEIANSLLKMSLRMNYFSTSSNELSLDVFYSSEWEMCLCESETSNARA